MFGIVLKQIRLSIFLTQKLLCEKANIPLGTYKNWELGRQLPDPNSWKKLLQFLKSTGTTKYIDLEKIYLAEKVKKR